jgi:prepilin-type N-terminal cleavage/methylation domain-containing protein
MAARKAVAGRTRARAGGVRAFTLIELLVVISIIALLVSILLPGLRAAREQAKRVVCQSNLKSVNSSLLSYITEFDSYPVLFQSAPDNCNSVWWASYSFGGWTGRDYGFKCDEEGEGKFCFQTHTRPLTIYMNEPNRLRPDGKGPDRVFGTGDDDVMEMPVFKCPSDKLAAVAAASPLPGRDISSYDSLGTSYHMNFWWFYQARTRTPVPPGDCHVQRWWEDAFERGMQVWRQADQFGGASRFVTMAEEPFDWAIAHDLRFSAFANAGPDFEHSFPGEQAMGWHGKWSKHVMAFMDGHVDYLFADTRYQREALWTVTNEEWYDTRRRENVPLPE